ncbi:MAG: OST-HTH/LOTUS domain-containing protein [Cyanobacteria bacterium P01_D01_bin.1]
MECVIGVLSQECDRPRNDSLKRPAQENSRPCHCFPSIQRLLIKECDHGAKLSAIGVHIKNQASFDARNYGYAKLSGLIEAIDLFELSREDKCIYSERS